jgi:alpha,alpha-trehalase
MMFKLDLEKTLRSLLMQEDTDGDKKITIEDKGPKAFKIISSEGNEYIVKGTYYLSKLLQ